MAKINIYEYVCSNNERDSIDLVKSIVSASPRNGKEAEIVMKQIMQGDNTNCKKQLLAGIVEIHPDADLFWEAREILQAEMKPVEALLPQNAIVQEQKLPCTGCGGSCGGATTLSATGNGLDSIFNTQLTALQTETQTNKIISDKLFKIIIATVILIIAYKVFTNKA
jgi:4-diphosphocytidyl-2C-methyl-D-erythritol kinase